MRIKSEPDLSSFFAQDKVLWKNRNLFIPAQLEKKAEAKLAASHRNLKDSKRV